MTTPRRSFSRKERARLFVINDGICHLCHGQIHVGEAWDIEHVIAWEVSRDDSDDNLRPAHRKCHQVKTHKHDRPFISKAKALEAKHRGFEAPKKKIQSRGFPQGSPRSLPPKPLMPKALYQSLEDT